MEIDGFRVSVRFTALRMVAEPCARLALFCGSDECEDWTATNFVVDAGPTQS